MNDLDHERHMRRAIELAANVPDLPFGAVIVNRQSGGVVAEGWNKSSINPTWHGEIDAINRLALSYPGIDGTDLVLYTTAEPCPMCQGAVLWGGIGAVVFGTSIRFLQMNGWRQIDIQDRGSRSPQPGLEMHARRRRARGGMQRPLPGRIEEEGRMRVRPAGGRGPRRSSRLRRPADLEERMLRPPVGCDSHALTGTTGRLPVRSPEERPRLLLPRGGRCER